MQRTCSCIGSTSAGRECMATSAVALAACLQPRSSLPRPIGVCRGRECGNQQPSHVISSSLHVVHVVHASGAYQQAAGAPMSPTAALHQPRPSAISTPDFARLPIGVCRGRECGNQLPSHVISSSLHVVHVVHASGAYQQAAGAPMSPTAALHQPRPSAISSPDSAISSARHVMSGHRRRHDHLAQYRRS